MNVESKIIVAAKSGKKTSAIDIRAARAEAGQASHEFNVSRSLVFLQRAQSEAKHNCFQKHFISK